MRSMSRFAALALAVAASGSAFAQATLKDDGQWRAAFGAGAAFASGNTKSTTFNLTGDAVKATKEDKLRLYGNSAYASNNNQRTTDLGRLGARYDYNLTPTLFGFGQGEFERDRGANLERRLAAGAGLGYHVIKEATMTWDVFGGVNYSNDRYFNANPNKSASYTSLLLGEESNHKLSDTTTFTQRLVVYPKSGHNRATFDAGLAVAMSKTMNLNVGLSHRYNDNPGVGLKKADTLLTTGISVKFE